MERCTVVNPIVPPLTLGLGGGQSMDLYTPGVSRLNKGICALGPMVQ